MMSKVGRFARAVQLFSAVPFNFPACTGGFPRLPFATTPIAARAQIKKTEAERAFQALADIIHNQAAKHQDFTLPNIGILKFPATSARVGRNPATGAAVNIPAGHKIVFKPLLTLKDAL
eukprot:gene11874-11965_t